jgi:CO dehydrogenase maturation factor
LSFTIAVAGKGGTGKTTISSLVIRHFVRAGKTPVFAVDADSNFNLNDQLGVAVKSTIGSSREEMKRKINSNEAPVGMSKDDWLQLQMSADLIEAEGFDLLVMGRPEGPGCYCFVNNLIRDHLDRLGHGYRHVLIDCEAGLEHLSRRTAGRPDVLVCVTNRARMAAETVERALRVYAELHGALPPRVDLVLNGFEPDEPWGDEMARLAGAEAGVFCRVLTVPFDQRVAENERMGGSLLELDGATPAARAMQSWELA